MKSNREVAVTPILSIAIAAMFLAGSAGLAGAQTQGKSSAAAMPPEISAASPAAQDAGVNPSAAGTQSGDTRSAPVARSVKGGREHSGSKSLSANTHPLAALKANRQLRKRQRTEQSLRQQIGGAGQAQQGSGSTSRR
jgi:hypothetical protein